MSFTNSWTDPRQTQTLQSPFQPLGEMERPTFEQYARGNPQNLSRIGPPRSMTPGEFHIQSRSSVSSLSGANGTASLQLRPRPSSDHSSSSSPSSDVSNLSHHQRELQLQWDMGLSGVGISASNSVHTQDLLSPGNTHAALLLESLDVNQGVHSPYTPSSTLSDLPENRSSVFSMAHTSYPSPPIGRFYTPQRSSSTNGAVQTSPNMMLSYSQPQSAPADHMGFPQANMGMNMHNTPSPPDAFTSSPSEVVRLRQIIHELQSQNQELGTRVEQLQTEVTAARFAQASTIATPADSNFGLSVHGQGRATPQTEASWRRRTDARVRKFCAPNRAGNALCAWHDTRRERRAYPPRMAPAGTLNCGCTVEQALFEESLARHGVGSYLPGDTVRMDPALRNPLLGLLQTRYGYRDGDFERDPVSGQWREDEGPERWEAELQRGAGKAHR